MRRACIDIGSNTTRLLVADCDGERLLEIHQERAFTHLRRGLTPEAEITGEKLAEVSGVVAALVGSAHDHGAADVLAVATAAVRRAANRDALVAAIRRSCGLEVEIVSAEREARLAFIGAARTLGYRLDGQLGVVDVGGGSSELVVGTAPDRVSWCASLEVGSADLADECLPSDPPSDQEISCARAEVTRMLDGITPPPAACVVAVGGSATSLRRMAGARLDADAFARVLGLLSGGPAAHVARKFGLAVDRVRLLPAGLLILEGAAERFGATLEVANGGLREGLLLETSHL